MSTSGERIRGHEPTPQARGVRPVRIRGRGRTVGEDAFGCQVLDRLESLDRTDDESLPRAPRGG